MQRILMIAAHFPPMRGSSGVQRTLKFCKYLPEHGWLPTVLTIDQKAHSMVGDDQLGEIPENVDVYRVVGFDAARQFSVGGRYPSVLAWPDRWSTWWFGGVLRGLQLVKQNRYDVLWSTYPIATAHLIARALCGLTRIPWVADFRDSMTEDEYPRDPWIRRQYRWIEEATIGKATKVVFTAPGTLAMYMDRYGEAAGRSFHVIPNGFDEEDFARIQSNTDETKAPKRRIALLHAGLLYPEERNPLPFFESVRLLKERGVLQADEIRIVLRSTGHDDLYRPLLRDLGIEDMVELAPNVEYRDALAEMHQADGLLLFQGANCNHQVPAKLFEYMRSGTPTMVLANREGDTAKLSAECGNRFFADIDSVPEISAALTSFVGAIANKGPVSFDPKAVRKYSRYKQTGELAALLRGCL